MQNTITNNMTHLFSAPTFPTTCLSSRKRKRNTVGWSKCRMFEAPNVRESLLNIMYSVRSWEHFLPRIISIHICIISTKADKSHKIALIKFLSFFSLDEELKYCEMNSYKDWDGIIKYERERKLFWNFKHPNCDLQVNEDSLSYAKFWWNLNLKIKFLYNLV